MVQRNSPPLTDRERTLLGLLAEGVSDEESASRLAVSVATMRSDLRRVVTKLAESYPPRRTRLESRRGCRVLFSPGLGSSSTGGAPERAVGRAIGAAERRGDPLSVVVLRFADSAGAVDRQSKMAAAQAVVESVRQGDWIGVRGAQSVVVVLSGTTLGGARSAGSRYRERAGEFVPCWFGAAEWQPSETAESLLTRADRLARDDELKRAVDRTLWTRRADRGG